MILQTRMRNVPQCGQAIQYWFVVMPLIQSVRLCHVKETMFEILHVSVQIKAGSQSTCHEVMSCTPEPDLTTNSTSMHGR
jgi:hypothetical protein